MRPLLYLASASPRRSALLRQIGVAHAVLVAAVDEAERPGETPEEYVERLALEKARATSRLAHDPTTAVLAADTTVVLDGALLGKPCDRTDALAMLARLSGRTHRVLTAVALIARGAEQVRTSASEVRFRDIDADERAAYWETGEPRDKAGAYAIQGYGAVFVAELRGSYSGVMGLPLHETAQLLRGAGIRHWEPIDP